MSLFIPVGTIRLETEVKKSRFIASLAPADSALIAEQFIAECRQQFPDATHNTFAYIVGNENAMTPACSDDGEVSGTAGRPMLNILQHAALTNVVLVVTRYYGGTLLGTGGLLRAYQQAAQLAVQQVEMQAFKTMTTVTLRFDYALEPQLRYLLPQYHANLVNSLHRERVQFELELPLELWPEFERCLVQISRGELEIYTNP